MLNENGYCLEGHIMMERFRSGHACLALTIALLACGAQAGIIEYELSEEFSGATPPSGSAPWLTATFDDGGTPGSVTLTLEATNLTGGEFVARWFFNLDPALNVTSLSFFPLVTAGAMDDPIISQAADSHPADGDGDFDILLLFSNVADADKRFGPGESVEFTIIGISTLTAASFNFLSASSTQDGLPTASHVQGIGEFSGWLTVPEPSSLALAAMGVFWFRRRRRSRMD